MPYIARSRAGLSSGEPLIPPVIRRSTWVRSLMWANASRSEVISTQFHPERSAQVAAEALTSSASRPGGVTVSMPSASSRSAARSSWSTSAGSFSARPALYAGYVSSRIDVVRSSSPKSTASGANWSIASRIWRSIPCSAQAGRPPGRGARTRRGRGGCGGAATARPRPAAGGRSQQPDRRRVPAYGVAVGRQHERHVGVPGVADLLDPAVAGVEPHLADVDRQEPVAGGRGPCRRRSRGPARRSRRSARTTAPGCSASTSSIRSCLRARPSRVPSRSRSSTGPSGKSRSRRNALQEV